MQIEETEIYDTQGDLLALALKLLENEKETLSIPKIAKKLDMSYFWISKLTKGEIANPSVNRIQYIVEKLTNKKLTLV